MNPAPLPSTPAATDSVAVSPTSARHRGASPNDGLSPTSALADDPSAGSRSTLLRPLGGYDVVDVRPAWQVAPAGTKQAEQARNPSSSHRSSVASDLFRCSQRPPQQQQQYEQINHDPRQDKSVTAIEGENGGRRNMPRPMSSKESPASVSPRSSTDEESDFDHNHNHSKSIGVDMIAMQYEQRNYLHDEARRIRTAADASDSSAILPVSFAPSPHAPSKPNCPMVGSPTDIDLHPPEPPHTAESPTSCMDAQILSSNRAPPFPITRIHSTPKQTLHQPHESKPSPTAVSAGPLHMTAYPSLPPVAMRREAPLSPFASGATVPLHGDCGFIDLGTSTKEIPNSDCSQETEATDQLFNSSDEDSQASSGKVSVCRQSSGILIRTSMSSISSSSAAPARRRYHRQRRPSTHRRVRGVWNPIVSTLGDQDTDTANNNGTIARALFSESESSYFDVLRNQELITIASYLDLLDITQLRAVNRRWRFVTSLDCLWKTVDATSFVLHAHTKFSANQPAQDPTKKSPKRSVATRKTSSALEQVLKPKSEIIESLTIRSIGTKLSADCFLPAYRSMRELTLTHFEDFSDTYLHVMFLTSSLATPGARTRQQGTLLRSLVLDDCTRLTNASLRSIATRCADLEELSLKRIPGITDITALQDLMGSTPAMPMLTATRSPGLPTIRTKPALSSMFATPPKSPLSSAPPATKPTQSPMQSLFPSAPAPAASNSKLSSMFAPPPEKAKPTPASQKMASMFAPPTTKPKTNSLQSLFGPPPSKVAPVPASATNNSKLSSMFAPPPPKPKSTSLQSLFGPPPAKVSPSSSSVTKPSATPAAVASLHTPPKQSTPKASSLSSMFQPPPPKSTSTPTKLTEVPGSPKTPAYNALQSLFAPPGTSPPRPTRPTLEMSRSSSFSSSFTAPVARLQRLQLEGTGVTVASVADMELQLESLSISGNDRDDWSALAESVSLTDLRIHTKAAREKMSAAIQKLRGIGIRVELVSE